MKAAIVLICLAALGVASWAFLAERPGARHLLVEEALARPLEAGDGAAILLAIDNRGAPDRLIAASSPLGPASFYDPVAANGLPIPTGRVSLALDAAHIRLDAASQDLADGRLIPLTLTFEEAGDVSVQVRLSDPAGPGQAQQAGLFGLGDICVVGEGEPAPEIALQITPDGDGWVVSVATEEFTFSEEFMDLFHVPGMGHGHLYVGGVKLGRMFTPQAHIGALPPGTHEIRVTLNTNDHRAYVVDDVPVTATAQIVVD